VTDTTGPQTLVLGPLTCTCTVLRAVDFTGQRMVRLVGGAGGWSQTPQPGFWAKAQASTVLSDVATQVGEAAPVVASDWTVSPFYCVDGASPASQALADLAGDGWWMDLTGTVQVGPRASAAVASPFTVQDVDGPPGIYHVSTEALSEWVPGAAFSCPTASGTVSRVMHLLDAGSLTTEVMVPLVATTPADRLRDAVRAELEALLPNWRYLATWEYTVTGTSGGPSSVTIDAVAPDGSGLPDVTGLPLRADASGSVAAPAVGSKCLVGFTAGDRRLPEVRALDGGTAPTTVWIAQGTMPVVRVGDAVQSFLPLGMPFTGVTSTGVPMTGTIVAAAPISGVAIQGSPIVNSA